jgi:hypothetical protein
MSADAGSELQSWTDIVAIEQLLYRYSDVVTRGVWEEDEALFVADAVLEIGSPFDARVEGVEAILDWRRATARFELLIHTTYSPAVRLLDPSHAKATAQTREMVRSRAATSDADEEPAAALNIEFSSVYYDDVVKVDGDWKFAHRRCQPIYMEAGALAGQVLVARSSLR